VAASAAVGLVPLVAMTLLFGQTNMGSVTGVVDRAVERFSWEGVTFYLRVLPAQIGWLAVGLTAVALGVLAFRPAWRPPRTDLVVLAGWLLVGYLFFWSIDLKEQRFTLMLLLPLAAAVYLVLVRAVPARARMAVAWLLAIGSFAATLLTAPVPAVKGHMDAARWIRDNTPPGVVLFSGKRDGSFIFNLRTLDEDRAYTVLRADKLLLELAIRRELGVKEKSFTDAEIAEMLTRYGVGYVVAERDFWTDLKPMAALQRVLESGQFEEVARIPIVANVPHPDRELRVFRNRAPLPDAAARIRVDLPAIGRSFEGEVSGSK
jgi:hypothetical protein